MANDFISVCVLKCQADRLTHITAAIQTECLSFLFPAGTGVFICCCCLFPGVFPAVLHPLGRFQSVAFADHRTELLSAG